MFFFSLPLTLRPEFSLANGGGGGWLWVRVTCSTILVYSRRSGFRSNGLFVVFCYLVCEMYSDIPFSHVVLLSSVCPFQVSEAEDPFGFKGVQCCLFSARNTDPKNFTDPEKFSANVEAAFAISRQLFGFFSECQIFSSGRPRRHCSPLRDLSLCIEHDCRATRARLTAL
jgi:hypothetical protein